MAGQLFRLLMATKTEVVIVFFQQLVIVSIMGGVAGNASALSKGFMFDGEFFLSQGLMAAKTGFCNGFTE